MYYSIMAMCTSRKESGPPMVAILQGLSADVRYAILYWYYLLPRLQAIYSETKISGKCAIRLTRRSVNALLQKQWEWVISTDAVTKSFVILFGNTAANSY